MGFFNKKQYDEKYKKLARFVCPMHHLDVVVPLRFSVEMMILAEEDKVFAMVCALDGQVLSKTETE